jgi:hypothetical protein
LGLLLRGRLLCCLRRRQLLLLLLLHWLDLAWLRPLLCGTGS